MLRRYELRDGDGNIVQYSDGINPTLQLGKDREEASAHMQQGWRIVPGFFVEEGSLPLLAAQVVEAVMAYGETTHKAGSWKAEGFECHMDHVRDHVENASLSYAREAELEELEHGLCRITMAYWSYIRAIHDPRPRDVIDAETAIDTKLEG